MFMEQKTLYFQDINLPQIELQMQSQIKTTAGFLCKIDGLILKFIRKCKKIRIAKEIGGGGENQVRRLTLSDFKTPYIATVIKMMWYCVRTDIQINWTKQRPEIASKLNGNLISDKDAKVAQQGKDSLQQILSN